LLEGKSYIKNQFKSIVLELLYRETKEQKERVFVGRVETEP